MSIRSIFTSHEKLFGEWMMNHAFNQEIQAEPRFPGENQDLVSHSYFTIPEESSSTRSPSQAGKILIHKIRVKDFSTEEKELINTIPLDDFSTENKELILVLLLSNCLREKARLQGKQISDEEVSTQLEPLFDDFSREEQEVIFKELLACFSREDNCDSIDSVQANLFGCSTEQFKRIKEKLRKEIKARLRGETISHPVYQIVHGPEVHQVEKQTSPLDVKYGNFWGRTYFSATNKHTGYFLVGGWLVVSTSKEEKENPYAINDDVDLTIAVKLDEGPDPVATKIADYMTSWVALQAIKLLIVFTASLVGAGLFIATSATFGKIGHLSEQLLSHAFLIGSIAMQAMVFYSAVKLYRLLCFTDKLKPINNLGSWVWQIRQFAMAYPDLDINAFANTSHFFTKKELQHVMLSNPSLKNEAIGLQRNFSQVKV
jgi:hypothetical protein